jgi:hypothetical protein
VAEIYDVRLVADDAASPISLERWPAVEMLLRQGLPARAAYPEGDPLRTIRVESYGGTDVAPGLLAHVEQLTGTVLHVECLSLRDLRSGFRDDYQRSLVAALIAERLADDRDQDECRYLMRFCWQLSMTYDEVTMPELREHVTEAKLSIIGELIRAVRQSPDSVDDWIQAVADAWPVVEDRGFQRRQASG